MIYETSMEAVEKKQSLIDLLMGNPEISRIFKREDIEKRIDPMNHIGMSQELTHRVVNHVAEQLPKTRPHEESERVCPLSGKDGHCRV
jgi:hypothetical protein